MGRGIHTLLPAPTIQTVKTTETQQNPPAFGLHEAAQELIEPKIRFKNWYNADHWLRNFELMRLSRDDARLHDDAGDVWQ